MNPPKFKIGDRVKWKDSDWRDRAGVIRAYDTPSQRYFLIENDFIVATWWHESHLTLDIQETPKFKIGDRVKWVHFGKPSFGFIRARLSEGWWKVEYTAGCMENCHESGLSLDVPEAPKFKIGDRVKWDQWGRIGVIVEAHADNRYSLGTTWGCLAKFPGDQLVLDVPEPAANSGLSNKLTKLAIALVNSNLSLTHRAEVLDAIMKPKQFATNREAELGAEIIKLHYDAADLDARLTKEIGERHRERIAKESAQKELAEAIESTRSANAAYLDSVIKLSSVQKELAEAREKIYMLGSQISDSTSRHACDATEASTVIADQEQALAEAREQIERLERKAKAQVESITHLSHRLTESRSGCEAVKQIETAQKALAEAKDMINRLKTFIGLP